jgi:hypothetical protein
MYSSMCSPHACSAPHIPRYTFSPTRSHANHASASLHGMNRRQSLVVQGTLHIDINEAEGVNVTVQSVVLMFSNSPSGRCSKASFNSCHLVRSGWLLQPQTVLGLVHVMYVTAAALVTTYRVSAVGCQPTEHVRGDNSTMM